MARTSSFLSSPLLFLPSQEAARSRQTRSLYSRPRLLLIPGNLSHIKTSLSKNGRASAPAMQMWPNPAEAAGPARRPPARAIQRSRAPGAALPMEMRPGPDRLRRAPRARRGMAGGVPGTDALGGSANAPENKLSSSFFSMKRLFSVHAGVPLLPPKTRSGPYFPGRSFPILLA